MKLIQSVVICAFVGAAVASAGCASSKPPVAQLAVAETSVQRINTGEAAAAAGPELQQAITKLADARAALARKDYDVARRLAEQANVDAQLAEANAQQAKAKKQALEAQDATRVLQEELNRKSGK